MTQAAKHSRFDDIQGILTGALIVALGGDKGISGVKLALQDDHLDVLSAQSGSLVFGDIGESGNQPHHAADLFGAGLPKRRLAPVPGIEALVGAAVGYQPAFVLADEMNLSIIGTGL